MDLYAATTFICVLLFLQALYYSSSFEFFQKVSIKQLGPSQKKSIVLFYFRAAMAIFWSLLNNLVWMLGKSLLNNQYNIFFKFYKPRTTRFYNRDLRIDERIGKTMVISDWFFTKDLFIKKIWTKLSGALLLCLVRIFMNKSLNPKQFKVSFGLTTFPLLSWLL